MLPPSDVLRINRATPAPRAVVVRTEYAAHPPDLHDRLANRRRKMHSALPFALGMLIAGGLHAGGVHHIAEVRADAADVPPIEWFFDAASFDEEIAGAALARLAERWRDAYAPLIVDLARLTHPRERAVSVDVSDVIPRADPDSLTAMPGYPGAQFATIDSRRDHPTTRIRARLLRFLRQQTGQRLGGDPDRWRLWTWSLPYEPHPEYLAFKADLYGRVEPATAALFPPGTHAAIRLDELEWTGFSPGHVPPLFGPAHVPGADARHVRDRQLVFGIALDGMARAYPARILAPHQLAHDRIGDQEVLVVHCPLSGVVAAYDPRIDAQPARFGTSGLVYRAHSLMFDRETRSLWSTMTGELVLGDVASRGLSLRQLPIVATTWGNWRREYPETTVIVPESGSAFTYVEGALTRQRLRRVGVSFPVPHASRALSGDADVVGVFPPPPNGARDAVVREGSTGARPIAIAVRALNQRALRAIDDDGGRLVSLSGSRGMIRVYDAGSTRFVSRSADWVYDAQGRRWRVEEAALVLDNESIVRAERLPVVWSSWEAWHARFPDSVLVK